VGKIKSEALLDKREKEKHGRGQKRKKAKTNNKVQGFSKFSKQLNGKMELY